MTAVAGARRSADVSMVRAGLSLLVSAAVLTLSGFGFWYVVGRGLDDQQLGDVAALTSLILFLSGVTRLNLQASLPAILPGSGVKGRSIVRRAYGLSMALGLVVSVAFVLFSELSGRGVIGVDGREVWAIPICVLLWTVFSIQDGALIAADESRLVAVENTAYSLVRLVGAGAVIAAGTVTSALLAWFLPLLLFIPAVNVVLLRRFSGTPTPTWRRTGVRKMVASDVIGAVAMLASTRGFAYLGVLALPRSDGSALAVVWLFFITIDVVFQQTSAALTVEATKSPSQGERLTRLAAIRATAIAIIGGAVGVVMAEVVLRLLISEPSPDAVRALQLVFVALTARPMLHVWLARARSVRDARMLVVGPATGFTLFVAGVVPGLMQDDLIMTIGGFAISQFLTAVLAWMTLGRLEGRGTKLAGSAIELADLPLCHVGPSATVGAGR